MIEAASLAPPDFRQLRPLGAHQTEPAVRKLSTNAGESSLLYEMSPKFVHLAAFQFRRFEFKKIIFQVTVLFKKKKKTTPFPSEKAPSSLFAVQPSPR